MHCTNCTELRKELEYFSALIEDLQRENAALIERQHNKPASANYKRLYLLAGRGRPTRKERRQ